jgi:hypothetical protein
VSVEEPDRGEHTAVIVIALGQRELHHDAVHVSLDRALCDPESSCDAGVRASLRHQSEHLTLARRQNVERIFEATGRDKLANKSRIHHRRALDDPFERLEENVKLRDARLQHVANALSSLEQLRRSLNLDVRGQNDDCHVRKLFADRRRSLEPFARMSRRHADVDDREFWLVSANQCDQFGACAALTDDLETGPLEQAGESLAQEDVVVCQHHAGRACAHTVDYGIP